MDYSAELFDQVQLLFDTNGFNDHELHCILNFEHGLDADILKKSVITSIEAISILGTRYVNGATPHWTSLNPEDFGRAIVIARTEIEFQNFFVSRVDEGVGPQISVCLLDSGPFTVALKILARYEQQFANVQDALSKGINAGDSDAAEAIRDHESLTRYHLSPHCSNLVRVCIFSEQGVQPPSDFHHDSARARRVSKDRDRLDNAITPPLDLGVFTVRRAAG